MTAAAPWTSHTRGWQRKMYGGELAFAAYATHPSSLGHSSLVISITISNVESISAAHLGKNLRSAWLDIRFNLHPLIASTASGPDKIYKNEYWLYYPLVDDGSALKWAEETVISHDSTNQVGLIDKVKEIITLADGTDRSRASLHFAPDTQVNGRFHLVFSAGHWVTDGRGAFRIFHRILKILNEAGSSVTAQKLSWGDEVSRLSLPLPLASGQRHAIEGDIIPTKHKALTGFLAGVIEAKSNADPIFLGPVASQEPIVLPTSSKTRNLVACLTLSPPESAAILDLCRSHHVTVTALFAVLIAIGFVGHSPTGRSDLAKSKTFQYPLFSVHRSDTLIDSCKASVGLQMVLAPLGVDAPLVSACLDVDDSGCGEHVWHAARSAMQQLVLSKRYNSAVHFDHEVVSSVVPGLMSRNDGSDFLLNGSPFFTSVGRITPILSTPTGARWTVSSPINDFATRWSVLTAHLWEWEGQTTLRILANAQYHTKRDLDKFVTTVEKAINRVVEG